MGTGMTEKKKKTASEEWVGREILQEFHVDDTKLEISIKYSGDVILATGCKGLKLKSKVRTKDINWGVTRIDGG